MSSTIKPRLVAVMTEAMMPISPIKAPHNPKVISTGIKFGIRLIRPSRMLRKAITSVAAIRRKASAVPRSMVRMFRSVR